MVIHLYYQISCRAFREFPNGRTEITNRVSYNPIPFPRYLVLGTLPNAEIISLAEIDYFWIEEE